MTTRSVHTPVVVEISRGVGRFLPSFSIKPDSLVTSLNFPPPRFMNRRLTAPSQTKRSGKPSLLKSATVAVPDVGGDWTFAGGAQNRWPQWPASLNLPSPQIEVEPHASAAVLAGADVEQTIVVEVAHRHGPSGRWQIGQDPQRVSGHIVEAAFTQSSRARDELPFGPRSPTDRRGLHRENRPRWHDRPREDGWRCVPDSTSKRNCDRLGVDFSSCRWQRSFRIQGMCRSVLQKGCRARLSSRRHCPGPGRNRRCRRRPRRREGRSLPRPNSWCRTTLQKGLGPSLRGRFGHQDSATAGRDSKWSGAGEEDVLSPLRRGSRRAKDIRTDRHGGFALGDFVPGEQEGAGIQLVEAPLAIAQPESGPGAIAGLLSKKMSRAVVAVGIQERHILDIPEIAAGVDVLEAGTIGGDFLVGMLGPMLHDQARRLAHVGKTEARCPVPRSSGTRADKSDCHARIDSKMMMRGFMDATASCGVSCLDLFRAHQNQVRSLDIMKRPAAVGPAVACPRIGRTNARPPATCPGSRTERSSVSAPDEPHDDFPVREFSPTRLHVRRLLERGAGPARFFGPRLGVEPADGNDLLGLGGQAMKRFAVVSEQDGMNDVVLLFPPKDFKPESACPGGKGRGCQKSRFKHGAATGSCR